MEHTTIQQKNIKWWSGGKSPLNLEYGKGMMWYFLLSDAFTFGAFLISYGVLRFSQNYWPEPSIVFSSFPGMGHANLPLLFVSVMTFVLIISSVTMVLAVHAGHKRDKAGVQKWLIYTIIGGLIFLACQAWEWTHLITAQLPAIVDGQLQLIGQRNGINPWGEPVTGAALQTALQNSSVHNLASLVSENHLSHLSHTELMTTSKDQLITLIDNANVTIRETGPTAFGGIFYGITGFHGFHVTVGVILNIIMYIMTTNNVFEKRGHYLMIEKVGLYWHFVDLVWVFVFLCFYLI